MKLAEFSCNRVHVSFIATEIPASVWSNSHQIYFILVRSSSREIINALNRRISTRYKLKKPRFFIEKCACYDLLVHLHVGLGAF